MIRDHPDGVVVTVRVQPGARRTEVIGVHDGALKVRIAAPPVEGRANAAVEAFVAELLGRRARDAEIVRGATSRTKQVLVRGVSVAQARERFSGPADRAATDRDVPRSIPRRQR